jgi:menaquinone-dependent protoporphyrinogen oxidase
MQRPDPPAVEPRLVRRGEPGPGARRVLVVYATHFGQTRRIAARLADALRDRHGLQVELADAAAGVRVLPPPEDYDVVVLGSYVELGRHAATIRAYLREHVEALADRPTAFFSVSMAAAHADAGPDPGHYLEALSDRAGWRPTLAVAIGGALPYRKYGRLLRFVMKQISRAARHPTDTRRNHELTDWTQVEALADQVAVLATPRQRPVPAR